MWRRVSRVGKSYQFADRIIFVGKGTIRLRIENRQDRSAVNATQQQAVPLNTYDSIFFVEY
jgi:hypothetical protein